MSIMQNGRPAHRAVALLAALGMLAGCAQGQFSTREGRIGPDDGTDSCRPQLVALDSTGNFFGAQILTGAGIGAATGALAGGLIGRDWKGALIGAAAGAALGAAGGYLAAVQQQHADQAGMLSQVNSDLYRENAQIDRTQLAFDQLTACRFRQANQIQANYQARRIDRPTAVAQMALVKQRAQRDVALAKQINQQINGRAEQFEVAADSVAPGARSRAVAPAPRSTRTVQTVQLKVAPTPDAPAVASIPARQPVTVTGARDGYAVVETASGQRGYAPVSAIQGAPPQAPAGSATASQDNVRTLAGSNAARRDSFTQSVAVSETAASSGFELAG